MRRLGTALCLIASLMLLVSCSGDSIVGSWQHDNANVVYTFNEDNTYTQDIGQGASMRNGTYSIEEDGKVIVFTHENGTSQRSEFKIEDKQLIFTSPDSGSVTTMTRIKTKD